MSHGARQRDPGLLVATLLALSTGLAILLLAESIRYPRSPSGNDDATESVELAHRFYGAVNYVLQTGDPSPLHSIAGPSIAVHDSSSARDDGRDAMIESILRLRTYSPGLRIAVDWATASSSGRVSVGVSTYWEETSSFAGLDLPLEARTGGWGPVEGIRIEGGHVVERWPGQTDTFGFEELVRIEIGSLPEPSARATALVRLSLPPRSRVTFANGGDRRLLIVENGRIGITYDSTVWADTVPTSANGLPAADSTPFLQPRSFELAALQSLSTRAGERLTIAAVGPDSAEVLVWVRYGARLGFPTEEIARAVAENAEIETVDASSPGVELDILASGVVDLGRAKQMSLGRVSMSSGSALTWPPVRCLVRVIADPHELTLSTQSPAFEAGENAIDRVFTPVDLSSSRSIEIGASMTWHAEQATTALVITLSAAPFDVATPVTNNG